MQTTSQAIVLFPGPQSRSNATTARASDTSRLTVQLSASTVLAQLVGATTAISLATSLYDDLAFQYLEVSDSSSSATAPTPRTLPVSVGALRASVVVMAATLEGDSVDLLARLPATSAEAPITTPAIASPRP